MEAYHSVANKRLSLEMRLPESTRRIWLENGVVHRMVVRRSTRLKVLQGMAWISHNGKDITLRAGQTTPLAASRQGTLVSPLGEEPLVFEVA